MDFMRSATTCPLAGSSLPEHHSHMLMSLGVHVVTGHVGQSAASALRKRRNPDLPERNKKQQKTTSRPLQCEYIILQKP
jgi:hypothetical protein